MFKYYNLARSMIVGAFRFQEIGLFLFILIVADKNVQLGISVLRCAAQAPSR